MANDNKNKKIKTCNILKVNIAVTNMKETVQYITKHIQELKGKYICVSNVHTTVMAYEDEHYRTVQNGAALALPDGKPLSVVSRKRGFKEAQRVTGPDLMLELFQKPFRHYFYGGKEETLSILEKKLREKYPDIQIAGMYSPPFRPLSKEEDREAVDNINASGADILWVGLGAPKQENWMYDHQNQVNALMIGVGAGFDYHAGIIKRAPVWMQKCSLEWLYRLFQDPRRLWKRYVSTNGRFLWLLLRKK
ncbi:MAG: WecB/TagA/CpsF family glycosyltransferase [Roseburia sp.]|nr:WecB/TagA/CpsF family glycosyltransferase [Roseburia sp.]MCM1278804.1 WecB/TagA/CpsF family glycosyltransferase [Robinsoniella sp.]